MNMRNDWQVIADLIPAGSRVLDLGCGDGSLLAELLTRKTVLARGVEKDEGNVRACVARGLSVRHGDIEQGLADFGTEAFDFVILSQTIGCLQHPLSVLREMLRIARFAVVSFKNAGHWMERLRALRGQGAGHTLVSGLPLIRSITPPQFHDVARCLSLQIERCVYLGGKRRVRILPTLQARTAIFVIRKKQM
jgi:methionine biosynthesis protein MetW